SEDYEDGVADYLDAIDPEVQVINNLTNIQNSIFVPHIPSLWNRRVNHDLPTPVDGAEDHIPAWIEMDEDERDELDYHVHHLLTRPQKLRRGLRGFGVWVRTPMGFIMLTYGVLVAGWGIVIMLFIWKWIDLHDPERQRWWEEICDRILCSLFAAIGIGFAPFRIVDTYRMIHIAHFHRLSWKRRKQLDLPKLSDPNDLPQIIKEREDVVVLTPDEQATLSHHQRKLHQSHSFYRYHETATHRAWPLDLLITIVCLLDAHSMLQSCLVGVTAGIDYHVRPTSLTAGLIACSLSCNAVAGFLIYWGGRKTKKSEEVERRLKIAIEEE
ncbi:hypothetical protein BCV69DRAFT_242853, partial [Microstroma glucosiphilum]